MAKWGTNSWEIDERHHTSYTRLGGLQSLISPSKGNEKKEEIITTQGIRFWSPNQVRTPRNRAQLCWADDTWCCPSRIVTLNAIFFSEFLRWEKVTERKNHWHCLGQQKAKKWEEWKWELLLALVIRQEAGVKKCYFNSLLLSRSLGLSDW